MHFPTVTGSNLERRSFTLPDDLEGEVNLVILAFWRDHQSLVDTWMPLARRLQTRHSGLVAYELPVIESRSRVSQWFIDSGMRSGIRDRTTREHTITLYIDKAEFLATLEIEDDSTIRTQWPLSRRRPWRCCEYEVVPISSCSPTPTRNSTERLSPRSLTSGGFRRRRLLDAYFGRAMPR